MTAFLRCFREILLTVIFVGITSLGMSQQVSHPVSGGKPKTKSQSNQLKKFVKLAAEANVVYSFPEGFKEIPPASSGTLSFDYALELPEQDFEVWFEVRSQRNTTASYLHMASDTLKTEENPDSLYNKIGLTLAGELGGGQDYFTTIIPPDYLAQYNATEGKTYLLDLADSNETKHYKYALLITLHKDHVGTIVAICLGNEKGPGFFKNIFKAAKSLKFKA